VQEIRGISLVFREMWDSTALAHSLPAVFENSEEIGRVPHVRHTCPGVPWGVRGPKKMGDPDFLPRCVTNVRGCGFH
jgi:hypothetical protein